MFTDTGGISLTGDVDAADIVLHGLNIVIPLMNAQLLQVSSVVNSYILKRLRLSDPSIRQPS